MQTWLYFVVAVIVAVNIWIGFSVISAKGDDGKDGQWHPSASLFGRWRYRRWTGASWDYRAETPDERDAREADFQVW
jgi:hypothetical protein